MKTFFLDTRDQCGPQTNSILECDHQAKSLPTRAVEHTNKKCSIQFFLNKISYERIIFYSILQRKKIFQQLPTPLAQLNYINTNIIHKKSFLARKDVVLINIQFMTKKIFSSNDIDLFLYGFTLFLISNIFIKTIRLLRNNRNHIIIFLVCFEHEVELVFRHVFLKLRHKNKFADCQVRILPRLIYVNVWQIENSHLCKDRLYYVTYVTISFFLAPFVDGRLETLNV